MKIQSAVILLVSGLIGSDLTWAQSVDAKQRFNDTSKKLSQQYADDKKLCAEEKSSSLRMQCLRDAKSEYDKGLNQAKLEMKEKPSTSAAMATSTSGTVSQPTNQVTCVDCGKVSEIKVVEKEGEGSAIGMIAGGVAGAFLGNQVGNGTGKDIATLAGAAGGAYAGKLVEQKMKNTKHWEIGVSFENGTKSTYRFDQEPSFKVGDLVQKSGDGITKRNP